jgi:hypothetical protein
MDKISVVSRQNEDRRKSALRERGISRLMKKRTAILLKPADTEFIAWRQDIQRFKQHYVSSLPCKEHPGAAHKGDFGYDTDASKAIKLSLWWLRRWRAQMEFCGHYPYYKEVN